MLKRQFYKRRSRILESGPLLTPLLDIMFLVLIFFMVNNSPAQRNLRVETPLLQSLPQDAPSAPTERILQISVRSDLSYLIQIQEGENSLNQWQADTFPTEAELLAQLEGQLNAVQEQVVDLLAPGEPLTSTRLRLDKSLKYGLAIAICELLYNWNLPIDLDVSGLSEVY